MPRFNTRKLRSFLRSFQPSIGNEKVRTATEMRPVERKVDELKERIVRTNVEGIPFDKNIEVIKNSVEQLQGVVLESQKNYQESIQQLRKSLEDVKLQQLTEHDMRLRQNKLLAIKGQMILLEKKLHALASYHRPRQIEPIRERLEQLKQHYRDILLSHKEFSDITSEVLEQPNLELGEIVKPISIETSLPDINYEKVQQAIAAAPRDVLELPTLSLSHGTVKLPTPLPEIPPPPAFEAVPETKKNLFSFLHKKKQIKSSAA